MTLHDEGKITSYSTKKRLAQAGAELCQSHNIIYQTLYTNAYIDEYYLKVGNESVSQSIHIIAQSLLPVDAS